jgi:hypothetical protein
MSCRKPCKECPWTTDNGHNIKFRTYVNQFEKLDKENHKCHMIDGDIWGSKSEINGKNVCIGSLNNKKLNQL